MEKNNFTAFYPASDDFYWVKGYRLYHLDHVVQAFKKLPLKHAQPVIAGTEALFHPDVKFGTLLRILHERPEVVDASLIQRYDDEIKEKVSQAVNKDSDQKKKRNRKNGKNKKDSNQPAIAEKYDEEKFAQALRAREEKHLISLAMKAHRPGPVQLRNHFDRIAMHVVMDRDGNKLAQCEVYDNGYAIYDDMDSSTVLWLPGIDRLEWSFNKLTPIERNYQKERAVITGLDLEDLPWPSVIMTIGEMRLWRNAQINHSQYQTDAEGQESEKTEKKDDNPMMKSDHENPEDIYLRQEAREERCARFQGQMERVYELFIEDGCTRIQIADALNISPKTVDRHLERIKIEMRNNA